MEKQRVKLVFWIIVIVAVFFRLWNFSVNDLTTDDALYSFRALGWFDYLGGGQTTPVQWFGHVPWWGNLSFHDAPPLVFFIQNAFFSVFGSNTVAARLPFVVAGMAVCVLVYFFVRACRGEKTALLAFFIISIFSYHIWISRVGYLEGIELVWIVTTLFLFALYRTRNYDVRYLLGGGAAIGLALISKYTALFIIPAALLYFIIWQRNVFKNKYLWASIGLCFLVGLPVIVYNVAMLLSRGHFDASLSSMVGMHPVDFSALSRSISHNYIGNFIEQWKILSRVVSSPFLILIGLSILWISVKVFRKQSDFIEKIIFLTIWSAMAMFSFLAPATRFLPILTPLFAIAAAIAIMDLVTFVMAKNNYAAWGCIIIVAGIFGFEGVYAYNTNITTTPTGTSGILYSDQRFYNYGFNQLDQYIQENIFSPLANKRKLTSLSTIENNFENIRGKNVVLYDESIDWFAYSWYIQRYQFFYGYPILSLWSYGRSLPKDVDITLPLRERGAKGFYFIYGVSDHVLDSVKKKSAIRTNMDSFASQIESAGYGPGVIKDGDGNIAFKIYYVQFKY